MRSRKSLLPEEVIGWILENTDVRSASYSNGIISFFDSRRNLVRLFYKGVKKNE